MSEKFLPRQLKEHPDFVEYRDAIDVFLDPEQLYSIEEAHSELEEELNREVDNG